MKSPETRFMPSRQKPHERVTATSLYGPRGDRKYINESERQLLLCCAAGLDVEKALFVQTLLWSGARISEVLALSASAFQVSRSIVALVTLKRRRHVVREVPLPPSLMALLDTHFELGRSDDGSAADIPARPGRLWRFSRVTGWRSIKAVMRHAGLQGLRATPRGLRHGFGVGTLQAGVPITLVQRWLGHARLSTTAIYADATGPEELAFAARFWAIPVTNGCR